MHKALRIWKAKTLASYTLFTSGPTALPRKRVVVVSIYENILEMHEPEDYASTAPGCYNGIGHQAQTDEKSFIPFEKHGA